MTVLLAAFVIAAVPFFALSALLRLSERLQDRRELERHRQIELTDAIHWELGAFAAPVVRRRLGGSWHVSMAVPLERSSEVATLVSLTAKLFAAEKTAERLEIVLKPATWNARAAMTQSQPPRQITTDRPLAA